MNIPTVNCM